MGLFGSFVFLSNLITGPGMLGLPAAFRFGGFILASGLTVSYAALSALSIAFIAHACRTYRAVGLRATVAPGAFEHSLNRAPHLELETLVRGLGSVGLWAVFQALFLASMSLMAISCIVVTATAFDALSVLLFGNAWGVQVYPSLQWVTSCTDRGACAGRPAFEAIAMSGGSLVSVGYMLTVALTAPMAMIDVSDTFQAVTYFLSLGFMLQLIVKFVIMAVAQAKQEPPGVSVLPPAFGWNAGLALEVSFWSWCISFAGPMWVEEKDVSTPLSPPLLYAFGHRALLDLLLGVSGAAAFPHMPVTTLNILDAVAVHPACGIITRASGIGFVVASLAANIVDYAMVASRNLECHVGTAAANILGIGLPFAVGWQFYFGATFASLVNAASPLLNGTVQFVVPALLFRAYTRFDADAGVPAPSLRVLNVSLLESSWRAIALCIATVMAALVVATYALNSAVSEGRIHPARMNDAADYS